jgi:hypothetical protein
VSGSCFKIIKTKHRKTISGTHPKPTHKDKLPPAQNDKIGSNRENVHGSTKKIRKTIQNSGDYYYITTMFSVKLIVHFAVTLAASGSFSDRIQFYRIQFYRNMLLRSPNESEPSPKKHNNCPKNIINIKVNKCRSQTIIYSFKHSDDTVR